MPDRRASRLWGIFLALLFIILIFRVAGLITDYLWFSALGFSRIFLISLEAAIMLFFVSGLILFVFLILNLWVSSRLRGGLKNFMPFRFKLALALLLSFIVGTTTSSGWMTVMQYFRQVPFNLQDPIFMKDVAFYVFSLPFLILVWKYAMACIVITVIIVLLDYFQSFIASMFRQASIPEQGSMKVVPPQFNLKGELSKLKKKAYVHISFLLSMFFVLLAAYHYLARFSIMYSQEGIVVGAGYTDVMVYLPAIKLIMFIALFIAVFLFIWMVFFSKTRLKKKHILAYTIAGYVLLVIIGTGVLPSIIQTFRVSPNELNLEKPYIENNIRFTRIAYGLSNVTEKEFDVEQSLLNSTVIANESKTIDNIRILDYRPLTTTYKQTQEIRLYYDLSGIDIDRYNILGNYTQVMVAPRELEQSQITANAQTWINLHMIYTHGYGIVMSPVNKVTKEGLPDFYIKDIPPVYTVDEPSIKVGQPEIYYGEKDNDYVMVNTGTEEFNYPKGNTNEYNHYDGRGGVRLDSFWKKLLMAMRFGDIKILLNTDITQDSRIMFTRNIQDRIKTITPFIQLDKDPYIVIANKSLYWIQDGYTVTGNFPYSQNTGSFNYIRNSLKIVVDAYNGDVTYYVVDGSDPLIKTYMNIFPDQFRPYDEMPAVLKKHVRYPEDLFRVQSSIYSIYHMDDPTVFYNKEDAWQLPNEIYGTGQQIQVEPYYIIIKLPGEKSEEFVIMTSFTPIKKDNMVAWMAARSDDGEYGNILLYKFSKDKLIYGPSQIEAKIDQDSEISQQLTLWSQQGSSVTRGNLLVIPIEKSILYVEPLYLQSEQGQLPELKRIIVSDGDRVAMENTLGEALEALFGKAPVKTTGTSIGVSNKTQSELIDQANTLYEQVQQSIRNGDWAGIGENLDNLGKTLEAMKSSSAGK